MNNPNIDISIPIYLKDKETFFRKERNGLYSLMVKDRGELGYLRINQMAKHIMEMCDGSHSIQNIVYEIESRFEVPKKAKLFDDIDRTIHILWRLGLIGFKSYNYLLTRYQVSKRGYTYVFMQEEDALEFNSNRYSIMLRNACIDITTEYSCHDLRIRWLNCSESFFKVVSGNEEVLRMAVRVNRYTMGYDITLLYISKPNNIAEVSSELFYFIDYIYKNTFALDVSSSGCAVFHFYSFDKSAIEMGFLLRGELRQEIKKQSVFLFEYQLQLKK